MFLYLLLYPQTESVFTNNQNHLWNAISYLILVLSPVVSCYRRKTEARISLWQVKSLFRSPLRLGHFNIMRPLVS